MPSLSEERTFDVIIVLGAAQNKDGSPGPAMERRVRHGVKLLQEGNGKCLLVSGGCTQLATPECETMAELAIELGATKAQLLLENKSKRTLENAACCLEIIAVKGFKKLLLVTDDFHMPRALATFQAFGLEVTPAPVPVSLTPITLISIARELIARLVYPGRVRQYLDTHNRTLREFE